MSNGDMQGWIIIGGLLAAAITAAIWKAVFRPRFIRDEYGERQRVDRWLRGNPVYDPKTWQQRLSEEAHHMKERRSILRSGFWGLVVVFGAAAWLAHSFSPDAGVILLFISIPAFIPFLFKVLPALWQEVRYQFGDQTMDGAKVLDKKPGPLPGREIVENQKAHGDARLASESEAHAFLNQGG